MCSPFLVDFLADVAIVVVGATVLVDGATMEGMPVGNFSSSTSPTSTSTILTSLTSVTQEAFTFSGVLTFLTPGALG